MSPRSGYAVVTLDVGGEIGLCDFVIDTGATTALITPKVLEMLDAGRSAKGRRCEDSRDGGDVATKGDGDGGAFGE